MATRPFFLHNPGPMQASQWGNLEKAIEDEISGLIIPDKIEINKDNYEFNNQCIPGNGIQSWGSGN